MAAVAIDPIGSALADAHTYQDRGRYHALLAQLRREAPLYRATPEGYRSFWAVTKHADICEIERQPDVFPSGPRLELMSLEQERRIKESTGRDSAVGKTLLHMDGAEHRAYRGMSQSWFMPKNLRSLEAPVNDLARQYVDKMMAAGGEMDFVKQISELFPLTVILMILGLPPDQAPELLRLTRNFTGREDAPVPEGMAREDLVVRASEEIFDFFGNVYEERRKHPRDDVATIIANATIDGRPIARAEALSYYLLLGLAGHDTTNSTMSGALLALMQNLGELERLRTSPDLLPSAVDEMLRWISPTNSFMRTASKDYELRGKRIRAGESLLLLFASANRDEEVFAEPFSFKVDRKPNPHIAFGYGAHACLGQYLAKMELRAFFGELIARLSRVELAGEPTYGAITTAYKITSLPIRYELRSAS